MTPSVAFICLCIIAVYSTAEKPGKTKRDVSGLFPFPRVGKSDLTWNSRFGPVEVKRQGLIPFPRIGRNGDGTTGKKSERSENEGAMWFGPRLGRLQKRNYDKENWALIRMNEMPALSDSTVFTSKLGEEILDEIDQLKDYRN